MNFQKMYNTRVLFGTKTKYNVHVHVSYFYGMKSGFLLYVLNALSDHHLFFFSNCDIITGVIQKVLPVLSTETLLHIWLSTEYYGFRPSCRYGGHPGFNDVKVICLGIFCDFTFRICF